MGSLASPPSFTPSSDSAYTRALARLFVRTSGVWRLGLERVGTLRRIVAGLDQDHAFPNDPAEPLVTYPIFHVAGTNGKGSVVATVASLLRNAGLRVGRYTSPHLVDFRERIVVDGEPIPEEAVVEWLERWDASAEKLGATFFETTTVMALDYFRRQEVDVAVIEVGLGGRLDATNIVKPIVSAVTQIGLDHREFLGDDLIHIASEKAGIFKAGAAAVIGERDEEVRRFLVRCAVEAGCEPVLSSSDWELSEIRVSDAGTEFTLNDRLGARRIHTPLKGEFQAHNAATAIAMLDAAGGIYTEIARTASGPGHDVFLSGRFQKHGRYIFDVAHNPDGVRALAENLRRLEPPRPAVAVVMVLNDKDWRSMLRELAAATDKLLATLAPTTPASRGWKLDEVAQWATSEGIPITVEPSFDQALDAAGTEGATVLITGSFHTVGDAMKRLQVDPLAR